MTPVLVFDIETVPDVAGLRRLRPEWTAMPDAEVAEHAFAERREKTGNDFLPLHLHRVAAISCVLRSDSGFRVGSIGSLTDGEGALIQAFFGMIDRQIPQLVSWNGGGFDLPVLHYRGLLLARLAGFAGKLGMDGARVWDAYQAGQLEQIRNYCETDVVNTYLLFNRFQRMRGVLNAEQHRAEEALVRETLGQLPAPHWQAYLAAWPAA
jgi:predicted PolB exonuclease-like 3'-5' exonuclease